MSTEFDDEVKNYYTKCDVCGKRFYGYDDLCMNNVDKKDYCPECSLNSGMFHTGKDGRIYANNDVWRIAHTFSSMYDGIHCYASSIDQIEKEYKILCVKHRKAQPMFLNWGFGLTGHLDDEHYRIDVLDHENRYVSKFFAYIYEPTPEEMEKLKKYGIREVKKDD